MISWAQLPRHGLVSRDGTLRLAAAEPRMQEVDRRLGFDIFQCLKRKSIRGQWTIVIRGYFLLAIVSESKFLPGGWLLIAVRSRWLSCQRFHLWTFSLYCICTEWWVQLSIYCVSIAVCGIWIAITISAAAQRRPHIISQYASKAWFSCSSE